MSLENARVLEGTWEEILLHAEELAGKKVSLTILNSDAEGESQTMGADAENERYFSGVLQVLFREADDIKGEPSEPSGDGYETAFGRIVTEKYRKQGFKI